MSDRGKSRVVGITGGIGSGKSRVIEYLATHCDLPVISLDRICRDLLEPGAPGWAELKKDIPERFFAPSGELDRPAFRAALFADAKLRSRVDGILHPLARAVMHERIEREHGPVLVEIPLLFEAGWQDDVDLIVVVWADRETRCERIVARDHVAVQEAQRAVASQQSLSEKAGLAHRVIDNSGSWTLTCAQLEKLAKSLGCRNVF